MQTQGGDLAYCRSGAGRAVVLIHGSLVTADDMVFGLMGKLSQEHDVIAFDRPGHGGSSQTKMDEGSPYAQAEMIAEAWAALGVERPIVIGHSFGGTVALSAAIAMPDAIAGVVALAPLCFPELRMEQLMLGPRAMPLGGQALSAISGATSDVLLLPLLRNAMFLPQIMPKAYAETFPFGWSSAPPMMTADAKDAVATWRALTRSAMGYAHCKTQVRIFGGTHDIVVSNARHGLAAAQMMPNAQYEWLAGTGHMIHHYQQKKVEGAVQELLAAYRANALHE